MSFVRTLATLAMGVAAVKGYQKVNQAGGLSGVQDAIKKNPQLAGIGQQLEQVLGKLGGQKGSGPVAGHPGLAGMLGSLGAAASGGLAGILDQITGSSAPSEAIEGNAKLMIRAMIQAARADGVIDAEERARIMEHLADATDEERAFVEEELRAPLDPLALARDTSESAKSQVYTAALMTLRMQNRAEEEFLKTLGQGLGLDSAAIAGLHLAAGKAAPKS